eukprot:335207-Chlamydomonas_euryale.AAC.5
MGGRVVLCACGAGLQNSAAALNPTFRSIELRITRFIRMSSTTSTAGRRVDVAVSVRSQNWPVGSLFALHSAGRAFRSHVTTDAVAGSSLAEPRAPTGMHGTAEDGKRHMVSSQAEGGAGGTSTGDMSGVRENGAEGCGLAQLPAH